MRTYEFFSVPTPNCENYEKFQKWRHRGEICVYYENFIAGVFYHWEKLTVTLTLYMFEWQYFIVKSGPTVFYFQNNSMDTFIVTVEICHPDNDSLSGWLISTVILKVSILLFWK